MSSVYISHYGIQKSASFVLPEGAPVAQAPTRSASFNAYSGSNQTYDRARSGNSREPLKTTPQHPDTRGKPQFYTPAVISTHTFPPTKEEHSTSSSNPGLQVHTERNSHTRSHNAGNMANRGTVYEPQKYQRSASLLDSRDQGYVNPYATQIKIRSQSENESGVKMRNRNVPQKVPIDKSLDSPSIAFSDSRKSPLSSSSISNTSLAYIKHTPSYKQSTATTDFSVQVDSTSAPDVRDTAPQSNIHRDATFASNTKTESVTDKPKDIILRKPDAVVLRRTSSQPKSNSSRTDQNRFSRHEASRYSYPYVNKGALTNAISSMMHTETGYQEKNKVRPTSDTFVPIKPAAGDLHSNDIGITTVEVVRARAKPFQSSVLFPNKVSRATVAETKSVSSRQDTVSSVYDTTRGSAFSRVSLGSDRAPRTTIPEKYPQRVARDGDNMHLHEDPPPGNFARVTTVRRSRYGRKNPCDNDDPGQPDSKMQKRASGLLETTFPVTDSNFDHKENNYPASHESSMNVYAQKEIRNDEEMKGPNIKDLKRLFDNNEKSDESIDKGLRRVASATKPPKTELSSVRRVLSAKSVREDSTSDLRVVHMRDLITEDKHKTHIVKENEESNSSSSDVAGVKRPRYEAISRDVIQDRGPTKLRIRPQSWHASSRKRDKELSRVNSDILRDKSNAHFMNSNRSNIKVNVSDAQFNKPIPYANNSNISKSNIDVPQSNVKMKNSIEDVDGSTMPVNQTNAAEDEHIHRGQCKLKRHNAIRIKRNKIDELTQVFENKAVLLRNSSDNVRFQRDTQKRKSFNASLLRRKEKDAIDDEYFNPGFKKQTKVRVSFHGLPTQGTTYQRDESSKDKSLSNNATFDEQQKPQATKKRVSDIISSFEREINNNDGIKTSTSTVGRSSSLKCINNSRLANSPDDDNTFQRSKSLKMFPSHKLTHKGTSQPYIKSPVDTKTKLHVENKPNSSISDDRNDDKVLHKRAEVGYADKKDSGKSSLPPSYIEDDDGRRRFITREAALDLPTKDNRSSNKDGIECTEIAHHKTTPGKPGPLVLSRVSSDNTSSVDLPLSPASSQDAMSRSSYEYNRGHPLSPGSSHDYGRGAPFSPGSSQDPRSSKSSYDHSRSSGYYGTENTPYTNTRMAELDPVRSPGFLSPRRLSSGSDSSNLLSPPPRNEPAYKLDSNRPNSAEIRNKGRPRSQYDNIHQSYDSNLSQSVSHISDVPLTGQILRSSTYGEDLSKPQRAILDTKPISRSQTSDASPVDASYPFPLSRDLNRSGSLSSTGGDSAKLNQMINAAADAKVRGLANESLAVSRRPVRERPPSWDRSSIESAASEPGLMFQAKPEATEPYKECAPRRARPMASRALTTDISTIERHGLRRHQQPTQTEPRKDEKEIIPPWRSQPKDDATMQPVVRKSGRYLTPKTGSNDNNNRQPKMDSYKSLSEYNMDSKDNHANNRKPQPFPDNRSRPDSKPHSTKAERLAHYKEQRRKQLTEHLSTSSRRTASFDTLHREPLEFNTHYISKPPENMSVDSNTLPVGNDMVTSSYVEPMHYSQTSSNTNIVQQPKTNTKREPLPFEDIPKPKTLSLREEMDRARLGIIRAAMENKRNSASSVSDVSVASGRPPEGNTPKQKEQSPISSDTPKQREQSPISSDTPTPVEGEVATPYFDDSALTMRIAPLTIDTTLKSGTSTNVETHDALRLNVLSSNKKPKKKVSLTNIKAHSFDSASSKLLFSPTALRKNIKLSSPRTLEKFNFKGNLVSPDSPSSTSKKRTPVLEEKEPESSTHINLIKLHDNSNSQLDKEQLAEENIETKNKVSSENSVTQLTQSPVINTEMKTEVNHECFDRDIKLVSPVNEITVFPVTEVDVSLNTQKDIHLDNIDNDVEVCDTMATSDKDTVHNETIPCEITSAATDVILTPVTTQEIEEKDIDTDLGDLQTIEDDMSDDYIGTDKAQSDNFRQPISLTDDHMHESSLPPPESDTTNTLTSKSVILSSTSKSASTSPERIFVPTETRLVPIEEAPGAGTRSQQFLKLQEAAYNTGTLPKANLLPKSVSSPNFPRKNIPSALSPNMARRNKEQSQYHQKIIQACANVKDFEAERIKHSEADRIRQLYGNDSFDRESSPEYIAPMALPKDSVILRNKFVRHDSTSSTESGNSPPVSPRLSPRLTRKTKQRVSPQTISFDTHLNIPRRRSLSRHGHPTLSSPQMGQRPIRKSRSTQKIFHM